MSTPVPTLSEAARLAAKQIRQAVLASVTQQASYTGSPGRTRVKGQRPAVESRYNIRISLRNGRVLVYNALSSCFALWDTRDQQTLERVKTGAFDVRHKLLQDFVSGNFVVPADVDELAEVERQYKAARFTKGNIVMTIAPTLACNFGCDYCFQGRDKPSGTMTEEVKRALYAYLEKPGKALKRLHIAWYGGEPLMARSVIYELSDRIIPMCAERKIAYSAFMVTNGFSLTAEVTRELFERRVTTFQVTIDGPQGYHDGRRHLLSGHPTYQTILDNLREAMEKVPIAVSVRVNIDVRNSDRIRELIDDLVKRGFGKRKKFSVYFAPVEAITDDCRESSGVTLGKVDYSRLEVEYIRYSYDRGLTSLPRPPRFFGNCAAVRPNGLLLTPNGDLYKCWDTVQDPSMRIGTIFEPDKVPEDPLHRKWLNWTPFADPVCRECKILPNCSGACAYKYIHHEHTRGEAGSVPCPSWKFNINERLFLRAEKMGLVKREDWDEEQSRTSLDGMGIMHSPVTVVAATEPTANSARARNKVALKASPAGPATASARMGSRQRLLPVLPVKTPMTSLSGKESIISTAVAKSALSELMDYVKRPMP